jgi:hypothetical protein
MRAHNVLCNSYNSITVEMNRCSFRSVRFALFLSFQPYRFYACPSGCDNCKSVWGPDVWKSCMLLFLHNFWLISVKKLVTFSHVVDFFFHRNLSLFLRILNWSANESKTLSFSDQLLLGRCWWCRTRGWGIEVQNERFERGCVRCSGDRSKQWHNWGVKL